MSEAANYGINGVRNLALAVIKSVIEEYGREMTKKNYDKVQYLEKSFFNETCNGWLDYFDIEITGQEILANVKRDINEGRWINFNKMKFKTREEAEKIQEKYPYAKYYSIIYHRKKNLYGFYKYPDSVGYEKQKEGV